MPSPPVRTVEQWCVPLPHLWPTEINDCLATWFVTWTSNVSHRHEFVGCGLRDFQCFGNGVRQQQQ
ncbi:hypothetical protein QTP88_023019 [Uroleucon formosanum]